MAGMPGCGSAMSTTSALVLPVISPLLLNEAAVRAHLNDLTKPPGSLGALEDLAVQLARIAGTVTPADPAAWLLTFAGDHGICAHGVSAYPAAVTVQMVANLAAGGAASSVFCRANRIGQRVIDVGVATPCAFSGVSQRNVVRGTSDATRGPAMTANECAAAVQAGIDEVLALPAGFACLAVGEMGISNSAVAAALLSAFTGAPARLTVGPGTGVAGAQLAQKVAVVQAVLDRHRPDPNEPLAVLVAVGGAEFAAMAGAMLAGAARGWPVLVDGFISGAAALVAVRMQPALRPYVVFAHRSTEPGARLLLEALEARPLLDLGLRLGEGTGAALAVPLVRCACAMLREMATFSGAGVSGRSAGAPDAAAAVPGTILTGAI